MTKSRKLKDIFKECLSGTTGHGIPNIIKTEYVCLKIFWVVVWLIGLGLTIYIVSKSIMDYFDFDIISQIQIINDRPQLFPKVTICNTDPFVTDNSITFLADIIRNESAYSQEIKTSGKTTDLDLVNHFILYVPGFKSVALFQAQKANLSTKILLGYDLNTIVQTCYFNENQCENSDFTHHYNLRYGNCFTFNSDTATIKKSFNPGLERGLRLELFVGKPDYYESFSSKVGAHIYIYNQTNLYTESEGIEVSAGFETSIALAKKVTQSLLYPYSDCKIMDTDSVSSQQPFSDSYLKLFSTYKYRSENCMDNCYQDNIHDKCQCIDHYYEFFNLQNITIKNFCNTVVGSGDYLCIQNILNNLFENCSTYCPFECDSIQISKSASFSLYPSKSALKILLNNSSFLANRAAIGYDIKSEILLVNVFYNSMSYEYLMESPAVEFFDLLSSLGGSIGLFLGFSVLSICEIVDLMFNLIMELLKRQRKTQNV